jgi:hypothetical protein
LATSSTLVPSLEQVVTDIYFYLVDLIPYWRQLMQVDADAVQPIFQNCDRSNADTVGFWLGNRAGLYPLYGSDVAIVLAAASLVGV